MSNSNASSAGSNFLTTLFCTTSTSMYLTLGLALTTTPLNLSSSYTPDLLWWADCSLTTV